MRNLHSPALNVIFISLVWWDKAQTVAWRALLSSSASSVGKWVWMGFSRKQNPTYLHESGLHIWIALKIADCFFQKPPAEQFSSLSLICTVLQNNALWRETLKSEVVWHVQLCIHDSHLLYIIYMPSLCVNALNTLQKIPSKHQVSLCVPL